jgi:hypothetical protein
MTTIIGAYNISKHDKSRFDKSLEKTRNDIAQMYAKGKISETHYKILNDKILEYESKISESIENDSHLSKRENKS